MMKKYLIIAMAISGCGTQEKLDNEKHCWDQIDSAFLSGYYKGTQKAYATCDSIRREEMGLNKPVKRYWYWSNSITQHGAMGTFTASKLYKVGDTTDVNGGVIIIASRPHEITK